MAEILSSILANTFSIADARRRVDLAQTFLEHERYGAVPGAEGGERLRDFYKNAPEHSADIEAIVAWGDTFFGELSGSNFYDKLHELKAALESLPVVTIYAPVAFTNNQLAELGQWCRKNINKQILLDMRIDPETVGGCSIAYGSAFQDLSFKHFAVASRPAITQLVHSYGI